MTWFDHLLALTLVVGLPAYAAWETPRLEQRVAIGVAHARTSEYVWTMAIEWALMIALIVFWWGGDRPAAQLGLVWPTGGARWSTAIISTVILLFFYWQARLVAAKADAQARVRQQLASQPSVRVLIPATPGEARVFSLLAISAGICEEVLYRGYLLWYFDALLPRGAAIASAVIAFGLAHAYQGLRGIVVTGTAGACCMALYLLTGSLAASIVLHSVVDLANGFMAYCTLRNTGQPESGAQRASDAQA
jgi:membrane protease YdiL (CAAX protease family)